MSEYKITYAVQKEILHFLDCAPKKTADTGQIAAYLHENIGHLRPKFCDVRWLEHAIYAMYDLLDARLVKFPAKPGDGEFCTWVRTAKDAGEYLAALGADEEETPEPADDREAIDAAWRAMRAEM